MRLIVLDTNVVVSAAINPAGAPARIVANFIFNGAVHLVTSPEISLEYRQVVQRAKFLRYGFPPLWLEYLIEQSMRLPNPPLWPHPCLDTKDAPFLALAHIAGAWLVTGNLKHFPTSVQYGVTVISPADYLLHLTRG